MKPAIIICSRKESSRIPNKAFKEIAGVPAIEHILHRAKQTKVPVVLAIPKGQQKDYAAVAKKYGARLYAGNPESPLHRIADYLKGNRGITHIVRVTHDDILIDARTIVDMLAYAKEREELGYVHCPYIVDGAGVEVIHRDNILHAAKNHGATEYISYFVRGAGTPRPDWSPFTPRTAVIRNYRLTMDYPEDWMVLQSVLSKVGKFAALEDVLHYLDHHAELLTINALPVLTFYTCAHNSERTIGKTIASVLNCGIENFEYIVVDDGSTDNTMSEIAKFSRDKRMKVVVNDKNRGLASSSNTAISLARGRYIMRVDADDVIISSEFPHHFWELVRALGCGAAIVYPAYYEIGETDFPRQIIKGDLNRHAGCALMRRDVLNEYRFRDGLRHWDGLELYKRISAKGNSIAYYDHPTWFYRVNKNTMSRHANHQSKRAKLFVSLGLNGLSVSK